MWSAVKQLAVRMMDNIKHVLPTQPDPRFTRPVPIAPEFFTYPTSDQEVSEKVVVQKGVMRILLRPSNDATCTFYLLVSGVGVLCMQTLSSVDTTSRPAANLAATFSCTQVLLAGWLKAALRDWRRARLSRTSNCPLPFRRSAGDPYRYHSHFVARVMAHSAPYSPLDLVSAGRLGWLRRTGTLALFAAPAILATH